MLVAFDPGRLSKDNLISLTPTDCNGVHVQTNPSNAGLAKLAGNKPAYRPGSILSKSYKAALYKHRCDAPSPPNLVQIPKISRNLRILVKGHPGKNKRCNTNPINFRQSFCVARKTPRYFQYHPCSALPAISTRHTTPVIPTNHPCTIYTDNTARPTCTDNNTRFLSELFSESFIFPFMVGFKYHQNE